MDEGIKEDRKNKNSCIQCGKILEKFEEVKAGGQVFKVCNKTCGKEFIRELRETRQDKLEKTKIDLKMNERELAYKKAQIGSVVLERNESKLYNLVSYPKDDLKPKHVLENERDMIEFQIKNKMKEIKNMEEQEEEDVRTT